MDAAGAVDAKNAPTAPWKTLRVSHSAHRRFLFFFFDKKNVWEMVQGPHAHEQNMTLAILARGRRR